MFQYRQVFLQPRAGQNDRQVVCAELMVRVRVAAFLVPAQAQGWLSSGCELPR